MDFETNGLPLEGDLKDIRKQLVADLSSHDWQARARAAIQMGHVIRRESYDILMGLLSDKNHIVQSDAVTGLAYLGDSRALFPLVNFYHQTSSPEVRKRIVQFMGYTRDPRSVEFLEEVVRDDGDLSELASKAKEAAFGNYDFVYTYGGSDEDYARALTKEERMREKTKSDGWKQVRRIHVDGPEALDSAQKIFDYFRDEYNHHRPQTYIVDEAKELYIGGFLQEHVEVAKGGKVKAAGQIDFGKVGQGWRVDYADNRSTGYFPDRSCIHWLRLSLEGSGIRFDKEEFDYINPRDGWNDPDFLSIFRFGEHYKPR